MDKSFIVEREGRSFVLYAGLLAEAHQQALKSIHTTLLQIPSDTNGFVAICQAVVETDCGRFSGIGDASPENVTRIMRQHIIRMSETRAKARALRDAVNVAMVALEELDADDDHDHDKRAGAANASNAARSRPRQDAPSNNANPDRNAAPPPAASTPPRGSSSSSNRATATTPTTAPTASDAQVRMIYAAAQKGYQWQRALIDNITADLYAGKTPAELTVQQASDLIGKLQNGHEALLQAVTAYEH